MDTDDSMLAPGVPILALAGEPASNQATAHQQE
jgi:hypothetical protein